ncbi:TOBE domain-containing protein [Leifsonia xyli]
MNAAAEHTARGTITEVVFLGPFLRFAVTVDGTTLTGLTGSAPGGSLAPGDAVSCGFDREDAIWLAA